jgi:hypothetical protein
LILATFFADPNISFRVPTNVHVFRGVPHGFRMYGDKLSGSKRWDEVMSAGISWALSKPEPVPFEIHSD